jgi:hypothetical protein
MTVYLPAVLLREWLHPFHREHRPREGVPMVGVPPRPRRPFDLPIRSEIVAGVVLVLVTVEDEAPGVEETLHQRLVFKRHRLTYTALHSLTQPTQYLKYTSIQPMNVPVLWAALGPHAGFGSAPVACA